MKFASSANQEQKIWLHQRHEISGQAFDIALQFYKTALLGATAPWLVEVDKSRSLKMALLGAATSTKVNDQHALSTIK